DIVTHRSHARAAPRAKLPCILLRVCFPDRLFGFLPRFQGDSPTRSRTNRARVVSPGTLTRTCWTPGVTTIADSSSTPADCQTTRSSLHSTVKVAPASAAATERG